MFKHGYVQVNNFQKVPFVYTFIKEFEQTFYNKTVLLCRKICHIFQIKLRTKRDFLNMINL